MAKQGEEEQEEEEGDEEAVGEEEEDEEGEAAEDDEEDGGGAEGEEDEEDDEEDGRAVPQDDDEGDGEQLPADLLATDDQVERALNFCLYEPFTVDEAVKLGYRDFQAEQKTLLLAREKRLRITVEYFGDDSDPLDFHQEAFDIIKWNLIAQCDIEMQQVYCPAIGKPMHVTNKQFRINWTDYFRSFRAGLIKLQYGDFSTRWGQLQPANIALIVFAMKIAYTRGFESPYTRAGS